LPPLPETLLPYEGNDEVVLDELWTFVQSKANTYWVWLALSRKNLQVIAFHVGGRDLKSAQQLWEQVPSPFWEQVPSPYRERLVFTDAYPVYERLFAAKPWQHCIGKKSEGFTSVIEGANNTLRQCVSYLGRKTAAFARSHFWLATRLHWFLHHWNQRQAQKFL
jgi:IS1 family transposase